MSASIDRRRFWQRTAGLAAGFVAGSGLRAQQSGKAGARTAEDEPLFRISLAQWSFHRRLRGRAEPALDNLEFAKAARGHGIEAIEYVNTFFVRKVRDEDYLAEMKKRAAGEGVRSLLIMCDGLGALGDPDDKRRARAIEDHVPWLAAAKFLGCHSVRVNAHSRGSYDEQMKLAVDGLSRLAAKGAEHGLGVLVENHGGLSSNGAWLAGVIRQVDMKNCGTLPDFGNFALGGGRSYDRYEGVRQLMPFAKAVSAKAHDFDEDGNEIHTDYGKMMQIVLAAGYHGFVGIEYEGKKLSEDEGVAATKRLLERTRARLAAAAAPVKKQP